MAFPNQGGGPPPFERYFSSPAFPDSNANQFFPPPGSDGFPHEGTFGHLPTQSFDPFAQPFPQSQKPVSSGGPVDPFAKTAPIQSTADFFPSPDQDPFYKQASSVLPQSPLPNNPFVTPSYGKQPPPKVSSFNPFPAAQTQPQAVLGYRG